MLINVFSLFEERCRILAERVKIELEDNLWLVIIDGEWVTSSLTEQRAREFAVKYLELEGAI